MCVYSSLPPVCTFVLQFPVNSLDFIDYVHYIEPKLILISVHKRTHYGLRITTEDWLQNAQNADNLSYYLVINFGPFRSAFYYKLDTDHVLPTPPGKTYQANLK